MVKTIHNRNLEIILNTLFYHNDTVSTIQSCCKFCFLLLKNHWFFLWKVSLTGYSSTWEKFCLRYLSLITEACAPVSSKTESNLLFSKTLMRHISPINLVTLCFSFVDTLSVLLRLKWPSALRHGTSKIVFGNFYHKNILIYKTIAILYIT